MWGTRVILGVQFEVLGMDNLPLGKTSAAVLLSKHQSTLETLLLPTLMPHPLAFVFKRELLKVPFFGWSMARLDMIHIDRESRAEAMKHVIEQGCRLLSQGTWVIMFPEGTRMPRGQKGTYQTAGTRLAVQSGAPVIPIAVATARCWPREGFVKHPGVVHGVDWPGHAQRRARPQGPDARGRGLDRGRDAPHRPRGLPCGCKRREQPCTPCCASRWICLSHVTGLWRLALSSAKAPGPDRSPQRQPAPAHRRCDGRRPCHFRHPRASREVRLGHALVAYEFKRGQRRSIGFSVGPDGLAVRAPKWVPLVAMWMPRCRKSLPGSCASCRRCASATRGWLSTRSSGAMAPACLFWGRRSRCSWTRLMALAPPGPNWWWLMPCPKMPQVPSTTPPMMVLRLSLPHHASTDQIRDVVQAWLMRQAKRVFQERLDHFAPLLGVQWKKLALSNAGTRWGSARADGSIRLNWRLIHFQNGGD